MYLLLSRCCVLARVSLVVLDNVWDRAVISAFDCGFKLVITTRQSPDTLRSPHAAVKLELGQGVWQDAATCLQLLAAKALAGAEILASLQASPAKHKRDQNGPLQWSIIFNLLLPVACFVITSRVICNCKFTRGIPGS